MHRSYFVCFILEGKKKQTIIKSQKKSSGVLTCVVKLHPSEVFSVTSALRDAHHLNAIV